LLACISCTGWFHCNISVCATMYLIRFSLSIIFPHPYSPLLRTILTGFTILFSYIYAKYIYHIHLPSPSLFWLVPSLGQDFVSPFCPVLFKVCIGSSKGFYLSISHTLYFSHINPLYYFSLLLCFPINWQFTMYFVICRCKVFRYYSLSILFPLLPPSSHLRQIQY
jgi:hypothetical protein